MTVGTLPARRALTLALDTLRASAFYARDRALARPRAQQAARLCFANHRRSDTLYILGSGGSINAITEPQWARIREADSLGFNNWIVHRHVPTYYALELPARSTPAWQRTVDNTRHNLQLAAPRYRAVPFLLAHDPSSPITLDYLPAALRPQGHLLPMQLVRGETADELSCALRVHRALGHMAAASHCVRSLKKRASVFRHVYFGLLAGYRTIVLAGIDLRDATYFFDAEPERYARDGYRLDHVRAQNPRGVHRTNDPGEGALTVSVVLDALDREVLRPAGVRLQLLSTYSALYPRFPLEAGGDRVP